MQLPNRALLMGDPKIRLRSQQLWWKKTNMTFRLMDLPKELQLNIYQHVLGGEFYLACEEGSPDRVMLGHPQNWDHYRPNTTKFQYHRKPEHGIWVGCGLTAPNFAILRVSKQVKEEALEAAWVGTPKIFYRPRDIRPSHQCSTPA